MNCASCAKVDLQNQSVTLLKKVMERKEGNQMARHPPQQLLSSIKITIEHGG